jgi:hypothetical protein
MRANTVTVLLRVIGSHIRFGLDCELLCESEASMLLLDSMGSGISRY